MPKKPYTFDEVNVVPVTGYAFSPTVKRQAYRELDRERKRAAVRNGSAFTKGGHLYHTSKAYHEEMKGKSGMVKAEAAKSKPEATKGNTITSVPFDTLSISEPKVEKAPLKPEVDTKSKLPPLDIFKDVVED
jgi:hypothetical protein